MLLFIPFRDESNLIAEGETAEVAFNCLIGENADLSEHHEKLQALLKAQAAVKKRGKTGARCTSTSCKGRCLLPW